MVQIDIESMDGIVSRIQELHQRFHIKFEPPQEFKKVFQEKQEQLKSDDFGKLIDKYARQNKLDPMLVKAVIKSESAFNWNAVSKKGAMGLMQLMPDTASALGVENPFDAEENIEGGTEYLADLMGKYNQNMEKALAAYNSGPSNVDKYNGVPPFRETREYVNNVLKAYQDYKVEAGK
jgi:soluble lytic murein transglycosylase-like protein